MFANLRHHWEDFKASRPGRRFQDVHKRRRQHHRGSNPAWKFAFLGMGLVLVAAGIFFLAVPGPGTVVLAIGLALIARESITMARFLDWTEVKLRPAYGALKKRWEKSSPGLRWTLLLLGSGAELAAAVTGYLMFTN